MSVSTEGNLFPLQNNTNSSTDTAPASGVQSATDIILLVLHLICLIVGCTLGLLGFISLCRRKNFTLVKVIYFHYILITELLLNAIIVNIRALSFLNGPSDLFCQIALHMDWIGGLTVLVCLILYVLDHPGTVRPSFLRGITTRQGFCMLIIIWIACVALNLLPLFLLQPQFVALSGVCIWDAAYNSAMLYIIIITGVIDLALPSCILIGGLFWVMFGDRCKHSSDEGKPSHNQSRCMCLRLVRVEPLNDNVEPLNVNVEPLNVNVEPLNDNVEPLNVNVEPLNDNDKHTNKRESQKTNVNSCIAAIIIHALTVVIGYGFITLLSVIDSGHTLSSTLYKINGIVPRLLSLFGLVIHIGVNKEVKQELAIGLSKYPQPA